MNGGLNANIYIYKLGSCQLAMFDYQRPEKKMNNSVTGNTLRIFHI